MMAWWSLIFALLKMRLSGWTYFFSTAMAANFPKGPDCSEPRVLYIAET